MPGTAEYTERNASYRMDWNNKGSQENHLAHFAAAILEDDPKLAEDLEAAAAKHPDSHKAAWLNQNSWDTKDSTSHTVPDTAAHKLFHNLMEATEHNPDPETCKQLAKILTSPLEHGLEQRAQMEFSDAPPADTAHAVWSTTRALNAITGRAEHRLTQALSNENEHDYAQAVKDLTQVKSDLEYSKENDSTDHPILTELMERDPTLAHELREGINHRYLLQDESSYSAVKTRPEEDTFPIEQPSWLNEKEKAQTLYSSFQDSMEGRSDAYVTEMANQLTSTMNAALQGAVRRNQLLDPASKWNEPNIKGFNLETWREQMGPQLTDQRQEASNQLNYALVNADQDGYDQAAQDLARIHQQVQQNREKLQS